MTEEEIPTVRGGQAAKGRSRPPKVLRMSVELPLWRALTGYRILTLVYALGLVALSYRKYEHPPAAAAYMGALTLWMALTWRRTTSAERCTRHFLLGDLGFAVGGILLTPLVDTHARIMDGAPTLPSIWTAGAVLGFAIKGGWRWARWRPARWRWPISSSARSWPGTPSTTWCWCGWPAWPSAMSSRWPAPVSAPWPARSR